MFQKIRTTLSRNLTNAIGWRTKRKIVVFESDDWGMVRMASKEAFNRLLTKGHPVDRCVYNYYDALERDEDIVGLMEVLSSVKDKNGNPAKFTLNNIVANPDFEKIKADNFGAYYFEPFTSTLKRYSYSDNAFDLFKEGKDKGLFQIQFHGREHVNINRWLNALQNGNQIFLDAFEEQMFTVATSNTTSGRKDFLDAFGMAYSKEYETMESIITSGNHLFKKIWGFQSKSFIAPCYIWPREIEPILFHQDTNYIQGTHVQRIPVKGLNLKIKRKYHYQGEKNSLGMRYLVRNAFFEPTESKSVESEVSKTLQQIENAFRWNKPAIVSSHRVNYIGRICPKNRSKNLRLLTLLLKNIIKQFPEVEFMSTDQLGDTMNN